MACNFLANKIKRWFNENRGKNKNEFSFRFRWKESFLYMKHFQSLIRMLFLNVVSKLIKMWLIEVHLQSIYVRKILSHTVRITDFNAQNLTFMKKLSQIYSKCVAYLILKCHQVYGKYVMPRQSMQNFAWKVMVLV